MDEVKLTLEEAIEVADTYSKGTARTILEALERSGVNSQYLRKIVLDAVNNFKRSIIRTIYEAE